VLRRPTAEGFLIEVGGKDRSQPAVTVTAATAASD
jgi:hypothetical protein